MRLGTANSQLEAAFSGSPARGKAVKQPLSRGYDKSPS